MPETLTISLKKAQDLRYGENPHQQAALYGDFFEHFHQLHGKELSYNNILDLTAAAELVAEFEEPTVAIIKHTNPCGVGSAATLLEAWHLAYETDKQAPFGGIIAVNRPLDAAIAQAIAEIFSEVIVAPEFEPGALAILQKKKNLRLIKNLRPAARRFDVAFGHRRIVGAGTRYAAGFGGGHEDRDQATSDAGGAARDPVRLARGQAREIQRHRVCAGRRPNAVEHWASGRVK